MSLLSSNYREILLNVGPLSSILSESNQWSMHMFWEFTDWPIFKAHVEMVLQGSILLVKLAEEHLPWKEGTEFLLAPVFIYSFSYIKEYI